uniref:VWFD domain-containing protein n=1 Tax=Oryctolagus cuniculus TaxID=9986 RepID=G1TQ78_RABIT
IGTDCVSPSQCGCSAGGRYHPAGEAFWAGERCERFCRCEASSHAVHCSPASCGPGQRCGNRRGIFGCHPLSPGTCHAAGHSGIITFDGRAVELPSTCASVFAESCGAPGSLPFFRVELGKENRNFRSHLVSFLYRVEVRLSSPGLTAHVILERGQQVQVRPAG